MDITTIILTIVMAVVYSLFFYIKKKVGEKEIEFAPKKTLRAIVWGFIIGLIMAWKNIDPTPSGVQTIYSVLIGYTAVVAIVDQTTLFIYRLLRKLYDKYLQ